MTMEETEAKEGTRAGGWEQEDGIRNGSEPGPFLDFPRFASLLCRCGVEQAGSSLGSMP